MGDRENQEDMDAKIAQARKELLELQERIRQMVERRDKIRREALGKHHGPEKDNR